jgi:5-methylcytosine-specific restriction protein A
VCTTPGCPETAAGGKCRRCRSAQRHANDRQRGSAAERGYGQAHRDKFRAGVLKRDPVCVLCNSAPAVVADHHPVDRRELAELGCDPYDPAFGRGLCDACDRRQTARRQPGGWRKT